MSMTPFSFESINGSIHFDFRGIYFLHCLFESKLGLMEKKVMNANPQAAQHMSFKQKLKRWVGKHPVLCTFLLIVVLWKGFLWHFNTPIKNPWPEHPYTIKGRFPFDKGFDIVFGLRVVGDAKWHRWVCGGFGFFTSHATCDGGIVHFYPNKIDGNTYQITMYKDYYLRGLPQWGESLFFDKPYRPMEAFDPTAMGISSNVPLKGVPIICDDYEKRTGRFRGELRCMPLYDDKERKVGHLKYKHLILPTTIPTAPNEQVMDFWLYSELDEMLKTQPAPISGRPQS
jgi:hypothetical protein